MCEIKTRICGSDLTLNSVNTVVTSRLDNLVWQISLSCLGPKIPWAFIPWKVPLVFPTFLSGKAGLQEYVLNWMLLTFSSHEEQWLSFFVFFIPWCSCFFVELGFFIAKTLLIWERNTTSCILEWLTREGSSNLFLLLNKAVLAYVRIISQACFSLLPLQMAVTKWQ